MEQVAGLCSEHGSRKWLVVVVVAFSENPVNMLMFLKAEAGQPSGGGGEGGPERLWAPPHAHIVSGKSNVLQCL